MRQLLSITGLDAVLTIDTNPDFIDYLKQTIDDPRFVAVLGSAADVEQIVREHGHEKADYIVSGLPFSTLPPGVGDAIAKGTDIGPVVDSEGLAHIRSYLERAPKPKTIAEAIAIQPRPFSALARNSLRFLPDRADAPPQASVPGEGVA